MTEEQAKTVGIIRQLKELLIQKKISYLQIPLDDVIEMMKSQISIHECQIFWNYMEQKYPDSNDTMLDYLKMCESLVLMYIKLEDLTTDKFVADRKEEYRIQANRNYSLKYSKQVATNLFTGKGVIYTVITGHYDELKEPEHIIPGMDYICFTDDMNFTSKVWKIRKFEIPDGSENLNKMMLSRLPKLLPHKYLKEYDYSIYVDGKLKIIGDLQEYISLYEKHSNMICFPHFVRDCVYEEARTCIELGKDTEENIQKQMNYYKETGYPEHNGLIDAACMVRRHNEADVIKAMEEWWNQMLLWNCKRDQLAFNYACYKSDFQYDISNLYIYGNPYLKKERKGELSC